MTNLYLAKICYSMFIFLKELIAF